MLKRGISFREFFSTFLSILEFLLCIYIVFDIVSDTIVGRTADEIRMQSEYIGSTSASDTPLLKTVAHIDLSDLTDLKLVCKDTEHDIAYYEILDESHYLEQGTKVYVNNGSEGIVTYTDVYGFAFECEDSSVVAGLSGTAVRLEDKTQVGYISKRLNTGEIYCIWN